MLQCILDVWPYIYAELLTKYASYVTTQYGKATTVCNGYEDGLPIKDPILRKLYFCQVQQTQEEAVY